MFHEKNSVLSSGIPLLDQRQDMSLIEKYIRQFECLV